ncbi:MAG: SGNH/GDSL hydrolase family protein, partial [Oscillospiraceae bacterium]|nr:SGNH/GDSL hydrolase family protein [Oscillospiraceae bacterium]
MSGKIKKFISSVLSAVMLIPLVPTIAAAAETANITIEYRKEEGELVRSVEVTEEYIDGDTYTVPDELKSGFVKKNDEGFYDYYEINESKSELSKEFASQMTLVLEVNQTDRFDYYDDFEDTTRVYNWNTGSGSSAPAVQTDGTKYIKHSTGSGSTGAYATFDEVSAENKEVRITADVKFTHATGSKPGLGEFSIGSSSPTFGSGNINYGIEAGTGHILALLYRDGTTLEFNKKIANIDFVDQWIHIEADADFGRETVVVKLTNEKGDTWEGTDSFYSSAVESNIGSIYLRSPGTDGTLGVDNLTVKVTGEALPNEPDIKSVLNYKSVYAFGDSIVYGHNAPAQSFMRLTANNYAMKLNMMAKNGATIMSSSNHILTQINNAPSDAPDIVLFEGYTNDAYGSAASDPEFNPSGIQRDVTECYGEITPNGTTVFDTDTFCGSFENTIKTMKNKWGDKTKYVFVTIHESNARNHDIQVKLRELSMAICEKWGVEVVDMFTYENSAGERLNTYGHTAKDAYMNKYIINGNGSHPTVAACEEFYIPAVVEVLESLYDDDNSNNNGDDKNDDDDDKDNDRIKSNSPAAVSGYVSMTALPGSVELVSESKTPVIHIDESDYPGVIRAANDLVSDIEAVTDKKPAVKSENIVEMLPGSSGITMTDTGMAVLFDYPVPGDSKCYVAAYNADGTLEGVKISAESYGGESFDDGSIIGFSFDERLTKPAGGKIKAFVWQEMKPVTGALGMLVDKDADLSG